MDITKEMIETGTIIDVRTYDEWEEGHFEEAIHIPLDEIIADVKGVGKSSMAVEREYRGLLARFGSEFEILLNAAETDIRQNISQPLASAIINMRNEKVSVEPGFDGEYGKVSVTKEDITQQKQQEQLDLF